MFELSTSLLAESFWQKFVHVLTTPSLQLFLLLGSLVLAISLLLLTMTKLGHARPITKCVVLSVIAHVLLLGYAYGTKLISHVPVAEKEESVSINLIEDDFEEPPELPITAANELVDEFNDVVLEEESGLLQRPEPTVPFEMERIVDLPETLVDQRNVETKPLVEIAGLQDQQPNFKIESPDIDFEVEDSIEDFQPESSDFQRRGERDGDLQEHEPDIESTGTELDRSQELEEVEIQPEILNENSFEDPQLRAEQYETELVMPDSENVLVEDFVSAASIEESQVTEANSSSNEGQRRQQQQRRLGDGQPLPKAYALRAAANRTAAKISGATERTEDAVESALAWLASVQKEDGRWAACEHSGGQESKVFGHDRGGCGSDAETGITALAALAFMGAGHSHLEGEYQATVQKALEYLIRRQESNGDLSGKAKLFARMYCHSMALLALSEALAVTGDYRLKQPVNLGIQYTLSAQDQRGGGWRYQPGDTGDMSQFGWKVMALRSAKLGGIEIDPEVEERMEKFLASCAKGTHGGLASYRPGEGPSTTMTAEALACKVFMQQSISKSSLEESQERLLRELPSFNRTNLYYWYYATLALHHRGGESWERWNAELQRVLLSQQVSSGTVAGSWGPDGVWGGYGGRIYSTALATMCLEVYYRYQRDEIESTKSASVMIPMDNSTPRR